LFFYGQEKSAQQASLSACQGWINSWKILSRAKQIMKKPENAVA